MTRRARARSQTHGPSRDRWLVSYADFITLLFAFFATLYAISRVDAQKLSTVAHGLQEAFDEHAAKNRVVAGAGVLPAHASMSATVVERSTDDVVAAVHRDLSQELASERLELIVDRRGVTLSIPEAGTFGVGSDELSTTAQELVARIATTLSDFDNPVRVEGHTDDVPIHNLRFVSNWDLSAARASRVVEFLMTKGLDPLRLSATGYGEFHPRVPNTSPETRAINRRIDLVVLNATARLDEPAAPGGPR